MNERSGIFIAGTDTGVGKTRVTAALVAALRDQHADAWPVKVVQTGSNKDRSSDLDYCLKINQLQAKGPAYERLAPVRLPLAASPHFAARRAGRKLQLPDLIRPIVAMTRAGQVPVVEGAGGLLVPLNARDTLLDLMQALGFPVILVARPGLGTLNHTLLSAHALDSAGLDLAAVVLSHTNRAITGIERDNARTLRGRLDCPIIKWPYQPRPGYEDCLRMGRKILRSLPDAR